MITADFYDTFADHLVLVISPHADDSVIAAGGLIHRLTCSEDWTSAGMDSERQPIVYNLVITPGYRGVDDNFLRNQCMEDLQGQYPELAKYLNMREGGAEEIEEMEEKIHEYKSQIRCGEAMEEGRRLGIRETFFMARHAIYDVSRANEEDHRAVGDQIGELMARHIGKKTLVLVPHQDDMHPAHKLSTNMVLKLFEEEFGLTDTTIWQYESPWFQLSPHQAEIIIAFDERSMTTKEQAMAAHRSQEYRTSYGQVARYRAREKAETLPELLGGFGQSRFKWEFVETFQTYRPSRVFGVTS